jgi:hypothetical protein
MDDLSIVRFHARETADGRSIRWTMPTSFVSATGLTGREHEIALVMHDGGRPASAPPAEVEVFFDDHSLGRVRVTKGFQTYTLQIPADLVASAAGRVGPAKIKLLSTTWNPREFLGGSDDRELGVMIDRVEIH